MMRAVIVGEGKRKMKNVLSALQIATKRIPSKNDRKVRATSISAAIATVTLRRRRTRHLGIINVRDRSSHFWIRTVLLQQIDVQAAPDTLLAAILDIRYWSYRPLSISPCRLAIGHRHVTAKLRQAVAASRHGPATPD